MSTAEFPSRDNYSFEDHLVYLKTTGILEDTQYILRLPSILEDHSVYIYIYGPLSVSESFDNMVLDLSDNK